MEDGRRMRRAHEPLEIPTAIDQQFGRRLTKAREMALRHVVPGVLLQPSGVFAVLRAQEAGCQYLMAS